MRHLIATMLAAAVLLIAGCGDDSRPVQPAVQGPIQQAPPATTKVDAAQQSLIAGVGNATATGNTAAAKAATVALKLEDSEAPIGGLSMFYGLAVLFGIAAALLAYEKNLKLAGLCLAGAGASVVGPILVTGLLHHEALVCWLGFLAIIAILVYHYRAQLKTMAAAGEADTAKLLSAMHLSSTESVLKKVYDATKADAEALLVKLHLEKAPSVPTAPPTITTNPTSPPKP